MPIYEYKCNRCGNVTEVIQKVSDAPLKLCKDCGGRLRKLVSSPAIQFKGTGWYVTDYARSGKNGDDKKRPGEQNAARDKAEQKSAPDKKDGASEKESDKKSPENKKQSSPTKPAK